jgi:hypothetical protein
MPKALLTGYLDSWVSSKVSILTPNALTKPVVGEALEILRESITEHDKTIAELAQSHPDYGIFSSLPGAGPAMTPRLIAAFGTQRDRYATASALQCYAGNCAGHRE